MVSNELIIKSGKDEVDIALLEDKRLVELHNEKLNKGYSVGDLYFGRVKKIMSGLNAAFVDVGHEKDAFLHYHDLGPQVATQNKYINLAHKGKLTTSAIDKFRREKDIDKKGKIADVLKPNDHVLVQVAKEPISSKGPRLNCELSIPGRFMVLVPFSDRISVSQRIKSADERKRLKRLVESIRPQGFGVIIRTVAEGKKVAELDADLRGLVDKWEEVRVKLQGAKPADKILGELDRTSTIIRDVMNETFNAIYVDDQTLYDEIRTYMRSVAPEKENIVKLASSKYSIFERYGIEKQIKSSFGKFVTMKSGAYLVIEHTEALHVVDVNSGNTAKGQVGQEEVAMMVNKEAAKEIARQLRLRDMGGIVVVDFIDMRKAENRKELHNYLVECMKNDKARHKSLPPSRFGLIQITRQRVRPAMSIKTMEKCPTCNGTGEIQSSVLLIDQIEKDLDYIIKDVKPKSLSIRVHPFVSAYLTKGFFWQTRAWKWKQTYGQKINVISDTRLPFLDYQYETHEGEEILL